MKSRAEEIRYYISKSLPEHPKDIVTVTTEEFSVSRTTVHRHLNRLLRDKKIIKTGTTRGASYWLPQAKNKSLRFAIEPGLAEDEIWSTYLKDSFSDLPVNVRDICLYGFTEMFNNALEHSEGKIVRVVVKRDAETMTVNISDNGIGIFRKIKNAFNFEDERESALQLSKGKLTTDPEKHTGEGIFFTSRAVDQFYLYSFGLCYIKDTHEDDWFLESNPEILKGTMVKLIINLHTSRVMEEVFKKYTSFETDKFDKTHILVELSLLGEERFISRSQAKRILWGLEKFKHVILDFKGISTVGQGFVDEVFRVYKSRHPEIKIKYTNANKNVTFMIERGLPETNS